MTRDKIEHFVCCYALALTGMHFTHILWITLLGVFSIGLFKELTDERFDYGDLLADAIGITAGILVYSI